MHVPIRIPELTTNTAEMLVTFAINSTNATTGTVTATTGTMCSCEQVLNRVLWNFIAHVTATTGTVQLLQATAQRMRP